MCLLLFTSSAYAQKPFNFGKTKERYFLSRTEIRELEIEAIYTVSRLQDSGEISFSSIGFGDSTGNYTIRDSWHVYTAKQLPPLDTLLEHAQFVNGSFWEFRNDTLVSSGMEGYGSLCYLEYTYAPIFSTALQYCKGSPEVQFKVFRFQKNNLKSHTITYHLSDTLSLEDMTLPISENRITPDTTYFVYNRKGKVLGIKNQLKQKEFKPILEEVLVPVNFTDKEHQLYINHLPFEQFIDLKIGFRPKLLLFEIYRNAVFTFVYDTRHKRYFQQQTLELE